MLTLLLLVISYVSSSSSSDSNNSNISGHLLLPLFDWTSFSGGSLLALTPDENYLITTNENHIQVYVRNKQGLLFLRHTSFLPKEEEGGKERATGLEISPDGKEILVVYKNSIGVFQLQGSGNEEQEEEEGDSESFFPLLSSFNRTSRLIPCWTNFIQPFYSPTDSGNSLDLLIVVTGGGVYGKIVSFRRHYISRDFIFLNDFFIPNATGDVTHLIINKKGTQVLVIVHNYLYSLYRDRISGILDKSEKYEICSYSNLLRFSEEENQVFIGCFGYLLIYTHDIHTGRLSVSTSPSSPSFPSGLSSPFSLSACVSGWPWSLGFSKDGRQVVVGCSDNIMHVFSRVSLTGAIDVDSVRVIELGSGSSNPESSNVRKVLFTNTSDGRAQVFVGLENDNVWIAKRVYSFLEEEEKMSEEEKKKLLKFVKAENNSITVSWSSSVFNSKSDDENQDNIKYYLVMSESKLYGKQTCEVPPSSPLLCTFKQPSFSFSNFSISIVNEVDRGMFSSLYIFGCPSPPSSLPSVFLHTKEKNSASVTWFSSFQQNPRVLYYTIIMVTKEKETNFSYFVNFTTFSPTTFSPTSLAPSPFPSPDPFPPPSPSPTISWTFSPSPFFLSSFTMNISDLEDSVPVRFQIVAVNEVGESSRSPLSLEVVPNICSNGCGTHGKCDKDTTLCVCDGGWVGTQCESWGAVNYVVYLFLPLASVLVCGVCGRKFYKWHQKRKSQRSVFAQINFDED